MPQAKRISSTCPVAAIFDLMNELLPDLRAADGSDERKFTLLEDRLYTLATAASEYQAASARGALLQIALVANEAGFIEGFLRPGAIDDPRYAAIARRLQRLLHSLRDFVSGEFGLGEEPALSYFLSQAASPFVAAPPMHAEHA